MSVKHDKRVRRHIKIRKNLQGTKDMPRLCIFRSNQHIYAQIINDETGKVLLSVWDKEVKAKKGDKKTDIAKELGQIVAKKAIENKIEKVVFDRAGILFHGRVKALADGAREGGLKF
jgi:large subunit ribosomal protein L18